MPCFLVGELAAEAAAMNGELPVHRFSHQAGHIAAALYSVGRLDLLTGPFLAFHLSGGTTEGVLVTPDRETVIRCAPGSVSLDLKAGQAVDRVGAMLGLPFPAGPALDKLSLQSDRQFRVRASAKADNISLSGIENRCRDMCERGEAPCDVARFALDSIAAALLHMIDALKAAHGDLPAVFAGGVMSNTLLRNAVSAHHDPLFAQLGLSGDNAVGVAVLGAVKQGLMLKN
jgi:N6-L-threonylcarbamoyladenine synthase